MLPAHRRGIASEFFSTHGPRAQALIGSAVVILAGAMLVEQLTNLELGVDVVRTTDYRGENVIAAYGPIGTLGLGMSLKVDAAEIYTPVRERLQAFVPLLLALVIAGAVVLRMQMKPLVAELVTSREALRRRTIELQQTNVELEHAAQAKDRFLATMSHELRTPLNAILGFTGVLLMKLPGPLTDKQERQLTTVQASAKHLLSLISDLLDLAKIESGKIELTPEPVVCQQVLNEVVKALHPMAEGKGLKLDCKLPPAEVCISVAQAR